MSVPTTNVPDNVRRMSSRTADLTEYGLTGNDAINFVNQYKDQTDDQWKSTLEMLKNRQSRDANMNSEDVEAEAKEFADNGEGQELADYKTSIGSPNATAAQEAVNKIETENNTSPVTEVPPQTNTPPETTTTEPQTNEEVVEEKKEVVNNKLQNIADSLGISYEDLKDMLGAYAKGKFPPGSKPFLIMNSITTGLSNILAQMDASRVNSSLSRIMRGAPRVEPQFQQSIAEQAKINNIKGQQDIMNKILGEVAHSATETGQLEDKAKEIANQGGELANEGTRIENEIKKETGMEAAKLSNEYQRLVNAGAKFDNLDKEARNAVIKDLYKLDLDEKRAAVRQLMYGGTSIKLQAFGQKLDTNAADIMNMGEAALDNILKAMEKFNFK